MKFEQTNKFKYYLLSLPKKIGYNINKQLIFSLNIKLWKNTNKIAFVRIFCFTLT